VMNIECGFSHNLDLEGAGLLHCPIRQVNWLSLIFVFQRAAGSAPYPLAKGETKQCFVGCIICTNVSCAI